MPTSRWPFVLGCTLNAAVAAFVYELARSTDSLAGAGALLAAGRWGAVTFVLALAGAFLPVGLGRVVFGALLFAAWVPPVHKLARFAVVDANEAKCRPLAGRPLAECEAAGCVPGPKCVPGGPTERGLCLDDGTPLSPVHCRVKEAGVCEPLTPRCLGVDEARCDEVLERGQHVCRWQSGHCLDLVAVCGSCTPLAATCRGQPFEVTWKAPWNER